MEFDSRSNTARLSSSFSNTLRAWILDEMHFNFTPSQIDIIIRKLHREPMKEAFTFLATHMFSPQNAEKIKSNIELARLSEQVDNSAKFFAVNEQEIVSKQANLDSLRVKNTRLHTSLSSLENSIQLEDERLEEKLLAVKTLEDFNQVAERLIETREEVVRCSNLCDSSTGETPKLVDVPDVRREMSELVTMENVERIRCTLNVDARLISGWSFSKLLMNLQLDLISLTQSTSENTKRKARAEAVLREKLEEISREAAGKLLVFDESQLARIREFFQLRMHVARLNALAGAVSRYAKHLDEYVAVKEKRSIVRAGRMKMNDLISERLRRVEALESFIAQHMRVLKRTRPSSQLEILPPVEESVKKSIYDRCSLEALQVEIGKFLRVIAERFERVAKRMEVAPVRTIQSKVEEKNDEEFARFLSERMGVEAVGLQRRIEDLNAVVSTALASSRTHTVSREEISKHVSDLEKRATKMAETIDFWFRKDWQLLTPWV